MLKTFEKAHITSQISVKPSFQIYSKMIYTNGYTNINNRLYSFQILWKNVKKKDMFSYMYLIDILSKFVAHNKIYTFYMTDKQLKMNCIAVDGRRHIFQFQKLLENASTSDKILKKIHVPKYAVLCGNKNTPGGCLMPLAKWRHLKCKKRKFIILRPPPPHFFFW